MVRKTDNGTLVANVTIIVYVTVPLVLDMDVQGAINFVIDNSVVDTNMDFNAIKGCIRHILRHFRGNVIRVEAPLDVNVYAYIRNSIRHKGKKYT